MESMCTCVRCSSVVSSERAVEIDGNVFCKDCIVQFASQKKSPDRPHRINPVFLCIAACVPGGGHMYMGLMKKGLLLMTMFFGTIYVMESMRGYGGLGLIIPIIWLYSAFDAIAKRRLINAGIPVLDEMPDILSFVSANKALVAIAAIVLIGIPEASRQHAPIGLLIIGFALFMFFSHGKKKSAEKKEPIIDIREDRTNQ